MELAARTALAGLALDQFAELDELHDLFAALDGFQGVLADDGAGLHARVVAAGAHTGNNLGALHALLKAADKVYRRFVFVLADLRINCHR